MLVKIINEWLCNVQLFPKVWILEISIKAFRISESVSGSHLKPVFGCPGPVANSLSCRISNWQTESWSSRLLSILLQIHKRPNNNNFNHNNILLRTRGSYHRRRHHRQSPTQENKKLLAIHQRTLEKRCLYMTNTERSKTLYHHHNCFVLHKRTRNGYPCSSA